MQKHLHKIILLFIFAANCQSFAQRAFTMRTPAFIGKGDALIIGNRILSGSSVTKDNHSTTMSHVDLDGDNVTTLNSSSATLTLPEGSTVYWAGLYWGGRSTSSSRSVMKFKKSNTVYNTITASVIDDGNTISGAAGENHYQCFSDVTSYIQTHGSGTYWGGDIQTQSGNGSNDPYGTGYYGGWALIVIYANENEPNRCVTVFDGYNVCWNNTVTVPISGFLTPDAGTFETKVGVIAWEGDLYITGDRLRMNSNSDNTYNILNTSNPGTNFFNGTITNTSRNPLTANNWGVDFDYLVSNISPPNGSTSTNMYFNSSGDFFLPGALIFTTEINPVLLPVTLVNQHLECNNGFPELHWSTQSEVNNRQFEIYQSFNQQDYFLTAVVAGAGTTSVKQNYVWKSSQKFSGRVFFKLVQTDFNGQQQSYSPLSTVCSNQSSEPVVYPNPFTNYLRIQVGNDTDTAELTLLGAEGRKIMNLNAELTGLDLEIDLRPYQLTSGIYFLRIVMGKKTFIQKLTLRND